MEARPVGHPLSSSVPGPPATALAALPAEDRARAELAIAAALAAELERLAAEAAATAIARQEAA